MAIREIRKNSREVVRITPSCYEGHDLIDVRVYAKPKGSEDFVPTKKGIAIPVDTVPEIIDALSWALGQPCDASPEAPPRQLSVSDAQRLAELAWGKLKKHGTAVHWDTAERIVLSSNTGEFTKWDLHFVLANRRDLFARLDGGCFRAV